MRALLRWLAGARLKNAEGGRQTASGVEDLVQPTGTQVGTDVGPTTIGQGNCLDAVKNGLTSSGEGVSGLDHSSSMHAAVTM
ncbi:hypothetical protein D3C84_1002950 [compost metagenome]